MCINIKIAIITITTDLNYGNRLQNYALQTFLNSLKLTANTIIDTCNCQYYKLSLWRCYLNFGIKGIIKYLINYRNFRTMLQIEQLKQPSYALFNQKYITFAEQTMYYDKVPQNLVEHYDFFIVGSDQVWNPNFKCTDVEFLTFALKEKRISYAASFGVSSIPEQRKSQFKQWLDGMHAISVRENAGADIVEELTGNRPEVLVDPTLLLSKKEWEDIAKKPAWYKEQVYILLYFLGDVPTEIEAEVNRFVKESGYKVIRLLDKDQLDWFCIGPDEFVYLIRHAELIYTDSFHGTVFSILMERPFVVCDRVQAGMVSMSSRIDTLLGMFKLENRRGTAENGYQVNNIMDIDFQGTEIVLEKEKARSVAYLKRAMNL